MEGTFCKINIQPFVHPFAAKKTVGLWGVVMGWIKFSINDGLKYQAKFSQLTRGGTTM